jgi:hypothetical protein
MSLRGFSMLACNKPALPGEALRRPGIRTLGSAEELRWVNMFAWTMGHTFPACPAHHAKTPCLTLRSMLYSSARSVRTT